MKHKTIPQGEWDEIFSPEFSMEELKRSVDRGYEIARSKHPELPPAISFRTGLDRDIKHQIQKKKYNKQNNEH